MELRDAIRKHDLAIVDGDPPTSRWVIVSGGVEPAVFGDLHRATDYTMCSSLPRERGAVFMFQRNQKPKKEGE